MLKNLLLVPAAAIAAFGLVACDGDDDDDDITGTNTPDGSVQTTTPSGETPGNGGDELDVELQATGTGGVAGMAVFSESGDGSGTDVTVTLADAAATGTAEIRTGTCDEWGTDVVANVGNVSAGTAAGSVDLSLDDIQSEDHVVVVMPAAGGDPISCGEI